MLCVEEAKLEAVINAVETFYADVRMCGDDMEIYADRMLLYDLQEAITALQKSAKKLEATKRACDMIEHYRDIKARNWWVRTTAGVILDSVERNEWIKGEKLVYFKAAMNLVMSDAEGFMRNGCDMGNVRYYDHECKGKAKKFVSVKARWIA